MARRRMMSEVPGADVIVTNPTHYAVALAYKDGQGGAPRVIAKGSGLVAAKIREIGAEHIVPELSAPPLARALHHNVELGHEIPAERSEEHTSELQSLMRISYAVFCLKKKKITR